MTVVLKATLQIQTQSSQRYLFFERKRLTNPREMYDCALVHLIIL